MSSFQFCFLSDPGIPGVRSMGPDEKITGENPEVRSDKRKSREEREEIEERDGREENEDISYQGHQSSVMSLSELTKTSGDMRMLRLRPIIIDWNIFISVILSFFNKTSVGYPCEELVQCFAWGAGEY